MEDLCVPKAVPWHTTAPIWHKLIFFAALYPDQLLYLCLETNFSPSFKHHFIAKKMIRASITAQITAGRQLFRSLGNERYLSKHNILTMEKEWFSYSVLQYFQPEYYSRPLILPCYYSFFPISLYGAWLSLDFYIVNRIFKFFFEYIKDFCMITRKKQL